MGQLVKIEPPTREQKEEYIRKRKRFLKTVMEREEYRNIFESGEDPYMWMDYYDKKRKHKQYMKEYGCDPEEDEDPMPRVNI
jgi:hypothetical protein